MAVLRTVLVALVALAVGGPLVAADEYPSRNIRLIVPFPAGGTLDVAARVIGEQLSTQMGQTVIIDNRGGANGIPGTDAVAKADPDGYTLLHVTASLVVNPLVHKKMPYNVETDLTPVTDIGRNTGYIIAVPAKLPVKTIAEFVKASKEPNTYWHFGSPGFGNTLHLAAEVFKLKTGANLTHVPYKGVAPAVRGLMGGEIQLAIMPPLAGIEHVKSGMLKVLAFTGSKRAKELPDVPTVIEAGFPELVMEGAWLGMFAPGGTPKPVVERLHAEMRKALATPKVAETLLKGGYLPGGVTPAEFAAFLKEERARYAEIVRAVKIVPK